MEIEEEKRKREKKGEDRGGKGRKGGERGGKGRRKNALVVVAEM